MRILTINNGHNSTAGVFEDGECLNIFHEEKFNNVKNSSGMPVEVLDYLDKLHNLKTMDLCVFSYTEQVAWSDDGVGIEKAYTGFIKDAYQYVEYITGWKNIFWNLRMLIFNKFLLPKGRESVKNYLHKKYEISKEKIIFTDHHLNHCLSPLYFYDLPSKNKDYLLISLDGVGDSYCAKVYKYNHKKEELNLYQDIRYEDSPGILYREVTAAMGFKRLEHEHKIMGLAAYVSEEKYFQDIYKEFKKLICFNSEVGKFEAKFNLNSSIFHLDKLFKRKRFDNIGAALQKITEELVLEWVRYLIKETNIKRLAFSGGVFMNVKLNQKILELDEVEEAYFQPSCGDDSLIVGAAANEFRKEKVELKPIKTMFLGHSYSNKEVEKYLKEKGAFEKYEIEYYDDIEKKSAELLANFEIVPRFKGQGEWGARSLCNRAILGNASNLETFYEVNDQVKMRDFWMPFAPTMLAEWGPKYIENWEMYKKKAYDSSKYMILTYNTTELARKHLRAAIHQKDFTMRPQLVDQDDSGDMYKLLKYYEELTGMGGLLNTSLNIHGYPLVGTLDQALFTLDGSGLKYMTLENFLLKKKS